MKQRISQINDMLYFYEKVIFLGSLMNNAIHFRGQKLFMQKIYAGV